MDEPRLIDANELIKCIEYWYESCSPRTDLRDMVICDTLDSVLQHIDDIPTAYDIDKVVEQLEELRTYEKDGQCPKHDKCSKEPYECTSCYTTTAIEIVKGGGIDE